MVQTMNKFNVTSAFPEQFRKPNRIPCSKSAINPFTPLTIAAAVNAVYDHYTWKRDSRLRQWIKRHGATARYIKAAETV